ncbi:MAG: hypothetical protein WCS86_01140 [Candidatus Paceibacterota bacterium]
MKENFEGNPQQDSMIKANRELLLRMIKFREKHPNEDPQEYCLECFQKLGIEGKDKSCTNPDCKEYGVKYGT